MRATPLFPSSPARSSRRSSAGCEGFRGRNGADLPSLGRTLLYACARTHETRRAGMSQGTWIDHFPGNFMWSNATLVCKGMAPYGAVAIGEIDGICERLAARGMGDPDAW